MTVTFDGYTNNFLVRSRIQTQGALVSLGVDGESFVLGGTRVNNPNAKVGFFWDENNHNRYWLINNNEYFEYLDESPAVGLSPIAIPFFLADFGINQGTLLNKHVPLEDVQKTFRNYILRSNSLLQVRIYLHQMKAILLNIMAIGYTYFTQSAAKTGY